MALATILAKQYGEPSAAWTRIVYLVTRASTRLNTADVDVIRERLQHSGTQLRVVYVDDAPRGDPTAAFNRTFWHDLLDGLPSSAFAPLPEAEAHALRPTVQMPTSHPTRMMLTFGAPGDASRACMDIPVQLLKATAQQRPPGAKRLAQGSGTPSQRQLDVRRAYYRVDDVLAAGDDLSKVAPMPDESYDSIQRAYKLGASLVPVPDALQALDTQPALEILHFVHASTYQREYHLGETYYVVAHPHSARSQIALSSLVQAAAVKGVYALARLVSRAHADPKVRCGAHAAGRAGAAGRGRVRLLLPRACTSRALTPGAVPRRRQALRVPAARPHRDAHRRGGHAACVDPDAGAAGGDG